MPPNTYTGTSGFYFRVVIRGDDQSSVTPIPTKCARNGLFGSSPGSKTVTGSAHARNSIRKMIEACCHSTGADLLGVLLVRHNRRTHQLRNGARETPGRLLSVRRGFWLRTLPLSPITTPGAPRTE